MAEDARRLMARLAVAVMAADGWVVPGELAALEGLAPRELPAVAQLERLGLGALSTLAFEAARESAARSIDTAPACAALRARLPGASAAIFQALVELAAVDGPLKPGETHVLAVVAKQLGLGAAEARFIVATVSAATLPADAVQVQIGSRRLQRRPSRTEVAQAHRVLGIEPGARQERIEAAYRRLVERYNPARVLALGSDFAALAVRRLAGITDAYATALGALEDEG